MRYAIATCFLAALGILAGMTALAQSQPADVGKGFMRAKLTHSQRILEGVTLKDFSAIARHAEQLKALSFDASWQVLRTEEYVRHGEEFRRAADRLTHAANGENLDAALLAYFRLTQNCVDCHEHVRDHRSP